MWLKELRFVLLLFALLCEDEMIKANLGEIGFRRGAAELVFLDTPFA